MPTPFSHGPELPAPPSKVRPCGERQATAGLEDAIGLVDGALWIWTKHQTVSSASISKKFDVAKIGGEGGIRAKSRRAGRVARCLKTTRTDKTERSEG